MLIDKDLRLSISGCFWLFYASKYILLELKNLTISQINQPITNTLSAILKRYSLEELANNNAIDLHRLIPIEYQVFTEYIDNRSSVKTPLLTFINTFRMMPNEERKRIFDS